MAAIIVNYKLNWEPKTLRGLCHLVRVQDGQVGQGLLD